MNLRDFLDSLPRGGVAQLARALPVSTVYLHQIAVRQDGREPSRELAVDIERETEGVVPVEEMRPQDTWVRVPDPNWPNPAGRPLLDLSQRPAPVKEAA